jgi:hypothetical protein
MKACLVHILASVVLALMLLSMLELSEMTGLINV